MRQYQQPGVSFQNGEALIHTWAPLARSVHLSLADSSDAIPLANAGRGLWTTRTSRLRPGDRYRFVLDDINALPDPASLKQPDGVHGPSEAVDLARLCPGDTGWRGIPLEEYIIYEIHVGTFSEAGTFDGVIDHLDHLKELGITAIELMPVAAFPGDRNWGYDGVFPFAAHTAYGGPEGLCRLVTAAHQSGLAVVLDVVYNHLGPEGNYFGEYGPYFTDKYKTPWGSAINFDDAGCDRVREYFITNALMWLRDFHIDALRLDAVHAIRDFSVKHILQEIREAADQLQTATGRHYHLIIENDLNDPRFIREKGQGYGMDAQWIDEFHHALRVASGQTQTGYYSDFNGLPHLAKAYRDAYVYDGQYSPHRDRHFGAPVPDARGDQFVVFSQNHDQVGNRMLGERTSTLLTTGLQRVLAAAVLLSPFVPLLFMGEEWAETAPFQYFISHSDPGLVAAVRDGRASEFKDFQMNAEVPDPQDEQTFLRCKLDWNLRADSRHSGMLRYYQALIRLRKTHPALKPDRAALQVEADAEVGLLRLQRGIGTARLLCLLNFSKHARDTSLPAGSRLLMSSADSTWNTADSQSGNGFEQQPTTQIPPESCQIYAFDV